MAKNEKIGLGGPHIDDFGFDAYDPLSPDIKDRNLTPMQKALKGAKTAAKETILSKDLLEQLVRAAAPAGYVSALDTTQEIIGTGTDLYNSVTSSLKPEITAFKRNARKMMPQFRDKLPNPLAKAIDKLLAPEESYAYDDYNPDEEALKGVMRDVFEAQLLVEQEHRAEDEAKQLLREKANQKRHTVSIEQLLAIRNGINRLASYQDTIAIKRDQKLIELQYRQYITQRDLLVETKRANVEVLNQLKAMVENSSLPDLAKVRAYEKRKGSLRDSLMGSTRETVDQHIAKFKTALGEKVKRQARTFGYAARMGLSGVNAAMSKAQMAQMMGDYGPSWQEDMGADVTRDGMGMGAELLGKRLGRMLRRLPGVGDLNERLQYASDNAPELLSDWAKRPSNGIRLNFWKKRSPLDFSTGFGAGAINSLKGLIPKFYEGTPEFTSGAFKNARESVSYDDLSRKTLVEIIPGYLSRILHSIDIIRTGDASTPRTTFSLIKDGFETDHSAKSILKSQIVPEYMRGMVGGRVNGLVGRLDSSNKLSSNARSALEQQMLYNMIVGRRFNATNLTNGKGLDQIQDASVLRELTGHFSGMFPLDDQGNVSTDMRTQRRLNRFSAQYQDTRSLIPNVDTMMKDLLDSGNREALRDIGALKRDGKREFLDPQFLIQALLSQENTDGEAKDQETRAQGSKNPRRRRRRNGRGGRSTLDTNRNGRSNASGTENAEEQGPEPTREQRFGSGVVDDLLDRGRSQLDQLIDAGQSAASDIAQRREEGRAAGREARRRASRERREESTATDEALDLSQTVEDVYVPGETEPRITRLGILAGKYICRTTKKVLKSLDDIQGPIVDATGNVVLTTADAMKGLVTKGGVRLRQISERANRWADRAEFIGKLLLGRGLNLFDGYRQGLMGLRGRIDDVYVLGTKEPALTAAKMREGHYKDMRTEKPIKTIDDVKGAVVDYEGNVVLTQEDYEKGLWLKDGTLVRRSGFGYRLGQFTDWYFGGYYRNLWKGMKWGAKKLAKVSASIGRIALGVPDVYVPGETSPRILAKLLRRGMYLSSKTGKRIFRLSQIDSDVLGPDGDVVLTLDELNAGVVDKYGRPVRALLSRALQKAFNIVSAPTRLLGTMWTKSMGIMGRTAKGTALGVTDALGWGIDKLTGFKKGSWQARRAKAEEDAKNKKDKAEPKTKEQKEKSPLWGPILMLAGVVKVGISNLLDKLSPLRYLKDVLSLKRGANLVGDVADIASGGRGRRRGRFGIPKLRGLGVAGLATAGAGMALNAAGVDMPGWADKALTYGGLAATAASFIPGASAAAGTALAAAGTSLLAVLTAPVTLGALAVAAVGVGSYYLWKKFGASPDPIQRVRLAEYGIASGDRDTNAKVLQMEELVAGCVVTKAGTNAAFVKQFPLKDIYALFGIDANNVAGRQQFEIWLTRRFRPVYLAFATVGSNIAPDVKVHEQDKKLPDGEKPRLVRETRFSADNPDYPYNVGEGPIPGEAAVTGVEAIDVAIDAVVKKFGNDERRLKAANIAKERKSENQQLLTGKDNPLKKAMDNTKGTRYSTQSSLDKVKRDTQALHGDVPTALWDAGSARRIDELAGIRLRTYGLVELDQSKVDTLLQMEKDLLEQLSYSSDGTAKLDYSVIELFQLYGPRFGVGLSDFRQRGRWIDWFQDRFLPTMLAFATAVRMSDKAIDPAKAWSLLKPADQVKVAQAVISATTTSWFRKISVWTITDSPWADFKLNEDSASTKEAIASLQAKVREAKLDEVRKSDGAPKAGTGGPEYFRAKDPTNASDQAMVNNINNMMSATGVATVAGVAPLPPTGNGSSSSGYSQDTGGSTGTFGAGSGGQYSSLPDSKGTGWENNKDLIVAAANMAGVDPGMMATFAGVESDFNPGAGAAKNGAKASSAKGLYQFISGTWETMLKRYGAKYGIPMGTSPFDPKANALMGAEFLKENRDGLMSVLNREPTDVDLYLAHFLGLGGAKTFMKLSGDANAAAALPDAAASNASIFYEKGGRPRTKNEVLADLNGRVQRKGRQYAGAAYEASQGGSGVATVDPVAQPTPAANDDFIPVAESDVKGGAATQAQTQGETAAPSAVPTTTGSSSYMGSAVPAMTLPPVGEPEDQLSPTAQNALGTQQAASRSVSQRSNKVLKEETVTLSELQTVLQKQLETQIASKELLAQIAEAMATLATTKGQTKGNDKSAEVSRATASTSSVTGPISMRRASNG